MMKTFQFEDIHCHPNLKTFGHSFGRTSEKSDVWFKTPPTKFKKVLSNVTGLTRFSQCDFKTMIEGNVRIAFVSYYPFEKGFFYNPFIFNPIAAFLGDLITGISYKRIRHIQQHRDYFADLQKEHQFFTESNSNLNGRWCHADSFDHLSKLLKTDKTIVVIPTIEGAHVFGTGLGRYGITADPSSVQSNIETVKNWSPPPLFITLAHNFDNELCGHAPSLERLGNLVDQSVGLRKGFSALGEKVVHHLLSFPNRILIDVKHMSFLARKEYYDLLNHYYGALIPVIVSHGAVTGTDFDGNVSNTTSGLFARDEINFFDEELIFIGRSRGLFGIQLDIGRLANRASIKKNKRIRDPELAITDSAYIVWSHIRHIAETLDRNGMFAWSTACIGSDFDGTINPLNGVWCSSDLNKLADRLLLMAHTYLTKHNVLSIKENKKITPEEVILRFTSENVREFLAGNYRRVEEFPSGEGQKAIKQYPITRA